MKSIRTFIKHFHQFYCSDTYISFLTFVFFSHLPVFFMPSRCLTYTVKPVQKITCNQRPSHERPCFMCPNDNVKNDCVFIKRPPIQKDQNCSYLCWSLMRDLTVYRSIFNTQYFSLCFLMKIS